MAVVPNRRGPGRPGGESHGDVVAKLLAVANARDEPLRGRRAGRRGAGSSGGEEGRGRRLEEPEVKAARLEKQAERMRQVKLHYRKDAAEIAIENVKDESKDDLVDLATVAGVHVAAGKRRRDKPISQTRTHPKSWTAFQHLRAAFTAVSTTAYALVMGCGHSAAQLSRAVVAKATLVAQAGAAKKLFPTETVTPWAIYSKMHDATKMEVTLPEEIHQTTL